LFIENETMDANKISKIKKELLYLTTRSSGPGGQNVNKVETKVTVEWHLASTTVFSDRQKRLLMDKLGSKLNKNGFLAVTEQASRSQLVNKEEVVKKLIAIIKRGLVVSKNRIKTKPSKAAIADRLDDKKKQSAKKAIRSKVSL